MKSSPCLAEMCPYSWIMCSNYSRGLSENVIVTSLSLISQGDILLVADEFDDGWMRGIRLIDLEVGYTDFTHRTQYLWMNICEWMMYNLLNPDFICIHWFHDNGCFLLSQIGFFPASFVIQDTSPIYKLKSVDQTTKHVFVHNLCRCLYYACK